MVIRCRATDIATIMHICNENWIISPLPVKEQFGGLKICLIPSVTLLCPGHIPYIIWGRNPTFGVWMHLGMAKCRLPFWGHCDDLVYRITASGAYRLHWGRNPKFGVHASWDGGVTYHFRITDLVDLDLISRIIMSLAYLLHYLR